MRIIGIPPLVAGVRGLALLSFVVGAASLCSAATLTFDVNQTIGANSLTGTITTIAGVVGALTSADIVSSDLTFDGTLEIIDPTGADSFLSGDDLTETASALYFNYEGTDTGVFDVDYDYTGPGSQTVWFNVTVSANGTFAPDGVSNIQFESGAFNEVGVFGNVAIAEAAAVPEPSASQLTLGGLVILGLLQKHIVSAFR